jgi:hypothetical protein
VNNIFEPIKCRLLKQDFHCDYHFSFQASFAGIQGRSKTIEPLAIEQKPLKRGFVYIDVFISKNKNV